MKQIVKCGQCGGETAKIDAITTDRRDHFTAIGLTCTDCGERTEIRVQPVVMEFEPGKNNRGAFCAGWARKR